MKTKECELLKYKGTSFKIPVLIYESVAEADKAAGKEGATLEQANLNLLYRGAYVEARDIIVQVTQLVSKIPFKTVKVKVKKEGKEVEVEQRDPKDTDAKYVERALDASPTGTMDKVQAIVTAICRGEKDFNDKGELVDVPTDKRNPLAVDIKTPERKSRVVKLAQKWKDAAALFVDGKKSLDKLNKAFAQHEIAAYTLTGNREADLEGLGWKCKAYSEAQDAFAKM